MGARDLLDRLASAGFSITADAGRLVIGPASRLTVDQVQAIRDHKPELLALLADGQAQIDSPLDGRSAVDQIPTRTCAGCQNLTRRKTCTEPAAAGLDPPLGHHPGADWFGIRWPTMAYGATCPVFKRVSRGHTQVNNWSTMRSTEWPTALAR